MNPNKVGGNFLKNVKEKNWGGKFWGVVRRGACDAVGMVRNEKKGKFSPKKFRGFFRGGRIQGDVCVGDCWEIKDQIGEKKFRGPEILGGTFGEMQKRGGKTFLGSVGGAVKTNFRGDFWKNVLGKFWG